LVRTAFAFMTGAAVVYLASGLTLIFAPSLFLPRPASANSTDVASLVAELYGVALLGLGVATWIAKRSPIGGIYGRALVAGNFANAIAATLVLARPAVAGSLPGVRVALVVAGSLAVGFTVLLFDLANTSRKHIDRAS
jgi:hypothetical protein